MIIRNEAVASGWTTTVDSNGETIEAIDLSNDCSGWQGAGGASSCLLLRGVEARFGNADQVYDLNEQRAAVAGWYNLTNGEHTFLGAGRTIRAGMQLDF